MDKVFQIGKSKVVAMIQQLVKVCCVLDEKVLVRIDDGTYEKI
jgi:hypothetical protein